MSTDPSIVYGPDRIGTRYGVVDAEHPTGHKGQDFRLPAGGGSEVVAYEECVVVECGIEVTKGFTAVLGWYVVAKAKSDGRYLGWAHLRRGTRAALGKTLRPGDVVGLAASGPRPAQYQSPDVAGINYPGTAWAGAHIHTTVSGSITGIFSGATLSDPLPRIKSALAATASSGKLTPITVATATTPIQEDDMPLTDADVNKITQGLRNAQWALGPHDEVIPFERAIRDLANRQVGYGGRIENIEKIAATAADRQVGYGARIEDTQVNLLPAVLGGIAALAGNRAGVDTDALAKALLPVLITGLGDRLVTDDDLAATRDAIITAIADVDENTLATFGLKRA